MFMVRAVHFEADKTVIEFKCVSCKNAMFSQDNAKTKDGETRKRSPRTELSLPGPQNDNPAGCLAKPAARSSTDRNPTQPQGTVAVLMHFWGFALALKCSRLQTTMPMLKFTRRPTLPILLIHASSTKIQPARAQRSRYVSLHTNTVKPQPGSGNQTRAADSCSSTKP